MSDPRVTQASPRQLMETREFSEKSDEILNCPQYLCYHVAYDTDAF